MEFQFDPAKAEANRDKHGVSFADAEGVFMDPLALHQPDPYSEHEDRWVAIGEAVPGSFWLLFTPCVATPSG